MLLVEAAVIFEGYLVLLIILLLRIKAQSLMDSIGARKLRCLFEVLSHSSACSRSPRVDLHDLNVAVVHGIDDRRRFPFMRIKTVHTLLCFVIC